jgi:serine protease Do
MFQRRVCKHVGLVGALALSLVMCSRLAAQSNRASTAAQTEHAVLDNSVDALQQISTAMQMLSKRVSASVVQIFSTGYISNGDREHRNTDLLSRGLTSGSGIIIGSDGWVVTNAHVVQGGRRIRVRLNQAVTLPARKNRESQHVFDAKLIVADRDTDLALLKIDATDLPTLELSDSNNLKQGQLVLAFGSPLGLDNSVSMGGY